MDYISIGKILNFHGINGEAKVGYSKTQADFISSVKEVLIKKENDYIPLHVSSCRFNKNFAIMKFKEISTINDLLPFKGMLLYVEQKNLKESLSKDEFLIEELIGIDVLNQKGENVGTVLGVSNNGVHDYLNVKTKTKRTSLIPFIKEFVPEIDLKNKRITVNEIEGLIE